LGSGLLPWAASSERIGSRRGVAAARSTCAWPSASAVDASIHLRGGAQRPVVLERALALAATAQCNMRIYLGCSGCAFTTRAMSLTSSEGMNGLRNQMTGPGKPERQSSSSQVAADKMTIGTRAA